MNTRLKTLLLTAAVALSPLAQAGDFNDRNELYGGLIGATVGAVIGSQFGDDRTLGAAIGGIGGFLAGRTIAGHYQRPSPQRLWRDSRDRFDGRGHARYQGERGYHAHARAPRIDIIDQPFRALRTSNIRRGPGPRYAAVGTLPHGALVRVVGRVEGTDWLLVARRDHVTGYVYAPLLEPVRRLGQPYGRR